MTDGAIRMRIEGGSITLDGSGLGLFPWFGGPGVHIPWANVMFVNPVPWAKKVDGAWLTFRDEAITPAALRQALPFYAFELALHDRHVVLASARVLARMWLRVAVLLKPLFVDEDQPHPVNGCIKLRFRARWMRRNGHLLLAALDMIEKHSRFDLLVTVD